MSRDLEVDALLSELRRGIAIPEAYIRGTCARCKRRPSRDGGHCIECIVQRGIEMRIDGYKLRRYVDLLRKVHRRQQMAREIEAYILSAPPTPDDSSEPIDDSAIEVAAP